MNLKQKIAMLAGTAMMAVPSMALAARDSFGTYVASLVANGAADQYFVYGTAMLFGVLAHYTRAFLDERIDGSVWSYFVTQFPSRTVMMLAAQIVAGLSMGLTGAWDSMSWPALIFSAFTAGYAIDSAVNKAHEPGPR